MERAAKSAKAKFEARPPIARKSRKTDDSTGRQLEQRLTEALEQQAATSEILPVISSSQADVQPVFDTILENAIRLCEGDTARLFQYDGQVLRIAAAKNTTLEGDVHLRENPLPLGTYNPTPQAGLERRTVHVLDVFAEPG
jgi:two-component system NtrC family sensor kinase